MGVISSDLPELVVATAEKLRRNLGWTLHRKCGNGSFGVVVEVSTGVRRFAAKIGKRRYDECFRLCVLAEAAILRFANKKQDDSNAVGVFSLKLVTDCGLDSGGAVLVGQPNYRVAVLAMELADCSARGIWKAMSKRFRDGDDVSLLRDLQSVIRGTVQVVSWMHECELAHGDLKPDNILLKKLSEAPCDWRVAYCTVEGVYYQIFLSDWGHAQWSGKGDHVYSTEGKNASTPGMNELACSRDDVVPLGARDLQVAFCLNARTALILRHPGFGTAWIQAPNCSRLFLFGDGIAQQKFDQSADIWALGAICARVFAAPWTGTDKKESESWTNTLHQASSIAEERLVSALLAKTKAKKVATLPKSKVAERAIAALNSTGSLMHGQAAEESRESAEKSRESWIESMVEQHYPKEIWQSLSSCITGQNGAEWKLLLDLLQGLLRYSAENRLTAKQAQLHPCISGPKHMGR
jgi:serine/threonine protein kinase